MRAVGFEGVSASCDQITSLANGAVANIRHANRLVHIGAKAAKDAFSEIERGDTLVVFIVVTDCASGTDGAGRTSVAPIHPVDFRLSAGVS